MIQIDKRAIELVKSYEGLRLTAYMPTPNDRPTIGYGHTKGVKLGDTCTLQQAERWLEEDMQTAAAYVDKKIEETGFRATPSMRGALVSLSFNIGLFGTTLVQRMREGDPYDVCEWFFKYRKQAGKDLRGLATRRAREMQLFLEDRF